MEHRKGDLLGGYFEVQRQWGSGFDFGSLRFTRHLLHGDRFGSRMTTMIVAVMVVLYALLPADRAPLPLLIHSGVLRLITLGGPGFYES
ncbi:hypothetical protein [Streptomyces regalis]|uniref:hypothetical protein n=1 Tax=Streptomyces regalis TaxID=68262 RepID=UPI000788BDCD|nr:hypothetical protein [Streptomyces regalis]